jgi:ribosomal protein S27AE
MIQTNVTEMKCPGCGARLVDLPERNRFMCSKCHTLWHISNVISEAVAGRIPFDVPTGEMVARAMKAPDDPRAKTAAK